MYNYIDYLEKNVTSGLITSNALMRLYPGADARKGIIKRALAAKQLIRIKKGLYLFGEQQQRPVHPYELARLIYGTSYVSFESALSFHGLIPEAVKTITCASLKRNTQFTTSLGIFDYQKIPANPFFDGVIHCPTKHEGGFLIASPEKALCDLIFVRKLQWNSPELLTEGYRIDETALKKLDLTATIKLACLFPSAFVAAFITNLKKALHNVS